MVLEIGHTSKSLLGEWAHPRAFPVFWLCACMTKTRALGPFSFIPNNSDNSLCELDEEHCAHAFVYSKSKCNGHEEGMEAWLTWGRVRLRTWHGKKDWSIKPKLLTKLLTIELYMYKARLQRLIRCTCRYRPNEPKISSKLALDLHHIYKLKVKKRTAMSYYY